MVFLFLTLIKSDASVRYCTVVYTGQVTFYNVLTVTYTGQVTFYKIPKQPGHVVLDTLYIIALFLIVYQEMNTDNFKRKLKELKKTEDKKMRTVNKMCQHHT